MKHLLIVPFLMLCISMIAQTSQPKKKTTIPFPKKGEFIIRAGVGVAPIYLIDKAETVTLPTQLQVSYRMSNHFNVGMVASFSASNSKPTSLKDGLPIRFMNRSTVIGVRGEYYTCPTDRWEVYGGGSINFTNPNITPQVITDEGTWVNFPAYYQGPRSNDPAKSTVFFTGLVGTTWHATRNVGIFGEVGYGLSLATVGIDIRL